MSNLDELLARIDQVAVPRFPATWFLDIDGVLNICQAKAFDWSHYQQAHVTNSDRHSFFFKWSVDLVQVINRLIERKLVVIRFLTTWEFDAQIVARVIGLKNPHGSWWIAGLDNCGEPPWWKLRIIRQYIVDEAGFFIWTDDDIRLDLEARQLTDFLSADQALVICPDEKTGLTPAHILEIVQVLETR